jgi:carbohydrate kinase (thermoresistant glucokinase family)
VLILVSGPTGSGKTTVGKALARQLGWRFLEGDDYHPPENIAKMQSGQHLDAADREPWLQALRREIDDTLARGENAVLAASALTDEHRRRLRVGDGVRLVFLSGDPELVRARVRARKGHFAGESILDDQFARLEQPDDALLLPIDWPLARQVTQIQNALGL